MVPTRRAPTPGHWRADARALVVVLKRRKDAQDVEEEVSDVEVELDGRRYVVVGRGAHGDHVDVVDNVQREEPGAAHLRQWVRGWGASSEYCSGEDAVGERCPHAVVSEQVASSSEWW